MKFPSISSVPTCTSSNADHLINRLYIRTSVFVSFETTFNIQQYLSEIFIFHILFEFKLGILSGIVITTEGNKYIPINYE